VVVKSKDLPADGVIAVMNGFPSLYKEYPNVYIEIVATVHIRDGTEDELIGKAAHAFKQFDRVREELIEKADAAAEKGCVS